jgi:phage terminase large subunit
MDIEITERQDEFFNATATEVLYGGAAGGGKSYGQVLDAMIYALKYPGSKQLILRRTFPELDKSIIRTALMVYPKEIYTFQQTTRTGRFVNGSLIDFGYCEAENDVLRYQGLEYDCIRFDELTHFTEFQYLYLMSRLRGANAFPKMMKSSTNPGNVGHAWVKARFVDPAPAGEVFEVELPGGRKITRQYIRSTVYDNVFLLREDPAYIDRLMSLPEKQRKALLDGNWNIFDGVRFTSFDENTHVIDPFELPQGWRRYRAMDYGLDRLACLWVAVDGERNAYVYKAISISNLIISDACKAIKDMTDEEIYATLAPPDLWSRDQVTGKSRAMQFADFGVPLLKVSNDRAAGWSAVDELLKVNENGRAKLKIFRNCRDLIKNLPQLQIDPKKPDDVLTEPHDITHDPDALRYFAVFHTRPNSVEQEVPFIARWTEDMLEDYNGGTPEEKKEMIKMWGRPQR